MADGDVEERTTRLAVDTQPDEPVLVLYVPATKSARACVLEVIRPIRDAGDRLVPIKVVNILDVSRLNFILDWIVTRYYQKDFAETANTRARFFLDRVGAARAQWGVGNADCSYTLYHPTEPPLAGNGFPTPEFLDELKESISRLHSSWNLN